MNLRGQIELPERESPGAGARDEGYAMAVLLVMLTVMAIILTVAMSLPFVGTQRLLEFVYDRFERFEAGGFFPSPDTPFSVGAALRGGGDPVSLEALFSNEPTTDEIPFTGPSTEHFDVAAVRGVTTSFVWDLSGVTFDILDTRLSGFAFNAATSCGVISFQEV